MRVNIPVVLSNWKTYELSFFPNQKYGTMVVMLVPKEVRGSELINLPRDLFSKEMLEWLDHE